MINVPPSRVDANGNRQYWSDALGKVVTVPDGRGRIGECPSYPVSIFAKAEELAHRLIDEMKQQSATVQAPDKTVWVSFREQSPA